MAHRTNQSVPKTPATTSPNPPATTLDFKKQDVRILPSSLAVATEQICGHPRVPKEETMSISLVAT
jgi:hypothetical protein